VGTLPRNSNCAWMSNRESPSGRDFFAIVEFMAEYHALDELRSKLDVLRPLDVIKVQAVQEKFRLEWTYHSNAIEGNPLSLSETSFFIREGLTSKGRPLSAYLEAKNHLDALNYLDSIVAEKSSLTEHLVRQYHAMLFNKIDRISVGSGHERKEITIIGGDYKKENNSLVRLDGKILNFSDWVQVPGDMERLLAWYRENEVSLHPVELASQLHHKFVSIHPFLDGNGRVARLLLNTVLMQRGYTPAIIPVEGKEDYYKALQAADDGSYESLFRLVELQLSKTLNLVLDVVEGRDAFDFGDLARMVSNMARMALDINKDLGLASEDPKMRAFRTGRQLITEIERVLNEHAVAAAAPGINMGVARAGGIPPIANADALRLQQELGDGNPAGSAQLSVSGHNRTVPQAQMKFYAFSGRFQVALFALSTLGQFGPNNEETLSFTDLRSVIKGSISFDDWDTKELHDFVLDYLKRVYQKFGQEIERRKTLIAQEEAERTAKYSVKVRP
jgi:Fic family protein